MSVRLPTEREWLDALIDLRRANDLLNVAEPDAFLCEDESGWRDAKDQWEKQYAETYTAKPAGGA